MIPAPRIPALLMRLLLPARPREAIAGDLDEQWTTARGLTHAGYWRLAVQSIASYWMGRLTPAPSPTPFYVHHEGDGAMQSFLQDVHYGLRLLGRSPGFTAAALLTLAIGIGANTAVFSLVNVQMLQPLPYRDPSRIVFVQRLDLEQNSHGFALSLADFIDVRQARIFDEVAAYAYWSANLTGGDQPERVQAYRVTANTFTLLGVAPLHGRGFTADEAAEGGRDVAVITFGLWQRRFGGDPSVIGRDVQVDGTLHTIVGVMPRAFEFPIFNFKGDLYAPLRLDEAELAADRASAPSVPVIARLRPGVSHAETQAHLAVVMRTLEREHPDTNRSMGARIIEMGKLDDELLGPGVMIVLATVACVLLLACANVANLLLARGVSRRRELAVRAALGASRGRIARQLLAESLLLGLGGGAVGAAFAWIALDVLRASLPEIVTATQPNLDALGLDPLTLIFTIALSTATALASGLLPAVRASRPHVQEGLSESAASGGSASTRRLRSALVVAEVALATAFLVVAGLLVRSYHRIAERPPGFEAEGVLTLAMTLPEHKYPDARARRLFYERTLDAVSHLPAAESADLVNVLPFSTYNRGTRFIIDGAPLPTPGREPATDYRVVSPGYFRTLRIRLLSGRAFQPLDGPDGARVAIVNRALVLSHFDGADPLGLRIRFGRADAGDEWLTIVGVVDSVHHDQLTAHPRPEVYVPLAQAPVPMMMLAVRTAIDAASLAPDVRTAIASVDPDQPVYHVKTLETLLAESLTPQTLAAAMVSVFSMLALALAAVGIYGVISYAVSQQTREFGIRMALGASPGDLMRLVLRNGLRLMLAGVGIGVCMAVVSTRLIAQALYGVGPMDPVTYLAVSGALAFVGLLACGIPAVRAMRIEPVRALRAN